MISQSQDFQELDNEDYIGKSRIFEAIENESQRKSRRNWEKFSDQLEWVAIKRGYKIRKQSN